MFKTINNLLTPSLINSLCKEFILEEKEKGDILWYEGDSGKKYFIIIEGEVEFLKEQK